MLLTSSVASKSFDVVAVGVELWVMLLLVMYLWITLLLNIGTIGEYNIAVGNVVVLLSLLLLLL